MTHSTLSASPSASAGQAMDRSAAGEAAIDDAAISDAVIDAATMDAATLSGMQSEMLRVGVAAAYREHPPGDDRQGTPAPQVVGGDLVEREGGQVVIIPLVGGLSTSSLVERIQEQNR